MANPLRTFSAAACVVALGFAFVGGSIARADDPNPFDGKLQLDVTPYIWVPTINATFRHPLSGLAAPDGRPIVIDPTQTYDTTIGPNQYLAKLNFALMGAAVLHYGSFALYGDFINLNASSQGERVGNIGNTAFTLGASAQGQVITTLWTIAPGVSLYHSKKATVDIIAGAQTMWLSTNGNAQLTGPLGNTFTTGFRSFQSSTAFVAGTTGHFNLGRKWSVPFFFDYGWGTPTSVQWLVGLKYGRTSLSWRSFEFNAVNNTDFVQHLNLSGLLLGYTFSF
jgi:hypothetical protein